MSLLDIVHPAARTLVDIAKSQDAEVGDGTTSVVLLAGELLRCAQPYVEDGVHPQVIIRSYRQATSLALQKIKEVCIGVEVEEAACWCMSHLRVSWVLFPSWPSASAAIAARRCAHCWRSVQPPR